MSQTRKIDMVILGLLEHENLTGYDIKKQIDGSINFFWKASFGSIYPALKDLEKNALIKKIKEDNPKTKREKIIYSITPKGREKLIEWLKNSKSTNNLKYETLLKLFFGGATPPNISLQTIEEFEEEIKENLSLLKIYQKNLSNVINDKDHIYYYLTVSFGIETYNTYLVWAKEAKKLLKEINNLQ